MISAMQGDEYLHVSIFIMSNQGIILFIHSISMIIVMQNLQLLNIKLIIFPLHFFFPFGDLFLTVFC